MHKRRQGRGWHQYFLGFKNRINCESVPRLPAIIVRYFLEAEGVECGSLVWRWMYESEIKESLTLHRMPGLSQVELRRGNGASQALEYTWHNLPRNGGRGLLVVCPRCRRPRRFLYAWQNDGECVRRSLWQCRECAGLRYRSEGTYIPREWRFWGGYPRTPPWNPIIVNLRKRPKLELTVEHANCY